MITSQRYPSELLDNAVSELGKLPGVGRKTALRLALHLLRQPAEEVNSLGNALIRLRNEITYCRECHNISETELCEICSGKKRDRSLVCVVESVNDVMAIEGTGEYNGLYHVLGGLIAPLDGISPSDLEIDSLVERVSGGGISEVIFALSPTVEGDTTSFYIYRKLEGSGVKTSVLARGISVGSELEYTDELTLGRSLQNRVPFN